MAKVAKVAGQEQPAEATKETGTARVYLTLRNEILTMKIAPGTHLDELGVGERFSVSRSPVREALVRLSAEGLVTILPNRGNIVTPIDFQRVPEFLDALDLLQRVTHRLAALHRTTDDIRAIHAAHKAYLKGVAESIKTGDSLPMIERNFDFHMAIAKAGRNIYFADLYRRLLDEGRRMLHLHLKYMALDPAITPEGMAAHHTEMLQAIEEGDADHAEACAHEHAVQFKGRFMDFLDRNLTAQIPVKFASRSQSRNATDERQGNARSRQTKAAKETSPSCS
ncbi:MULTISPECIES: GntR family transcriptional regulator [unclassified Burkholderia]|uniref:GntR family transcriptional regulator n=1 Tax=unclassified Burkholderia TaxID=2613784 RepID=UPI000F56BD68|nr:MULTISPECIES: GntR family transcriptional regulator [unclassified Burkholderia]RQR36045.1 GntR family transcriptional regulator [Burkholderia sp. Bp9142]RQR46649.1 GntR family transcriptional regulator [Burkholderia sp. Bp9140]